MQSPILQKFKFLYVGAVVTLLGHDCKFVTKLLRFNLGQNLKRSYRTKKKVVLVCKYIDSLENINIIR